jgi:hypothetical protein
MENGLKILVSELQKQNQILQIVNQKAGQIILQSEQRIKLTEQQLLVSDEKLQSIRPTNPS